MAEHVLFITVGEAITLSFHIPDEIKSPEHYVRFSELARCLEDTDTLEIIISGSPGGLLSGARLITTIMDTCKAPSEVVVIDGIASAATMIAVNADSLVMTLGSSMMIHNVSYGTGGKASDIEAYVTFNTKDIKDTMTHFYRPFMTAKELKRLLKGEEYYLDAYDCVQRFAKVVKKREKAANKLRKTMLFEQKDIMLANLETIEAMLDE